jgi:murein DD-endopeptidase MepM/ murein hydrolase activator NlpD
VADDGRIEPDFDPLAAASPGAAAGVQAPPEVMRRVQELAARIELDALRAEHAQTQAERFPTAQGDGPGAMHWPAQGDVASGFGWRTDAVTGARQWHAGVDIAGAEGDPVQACWPGKVIFSGQRGRFGNLVVVEHPGGWRSYYGHNKVNLVGEGDQVEAGSKIAELGASGRTGEPHLHFEIRRGDQAENPADVMQRLQAGLSRAGANPVE